MKKYLLVLCLAGVLVLTGCSGKNVSKIEPESKTTEKQEEEKEKNTKRKKETKKDNKEKKKTERDTEKEYVEEETFSFADVSKHEFYLSSGLGAWGTILCISEDGTFEGNYHDSNMGDSGEGYPKGTIHICNFRGKFTSPKRVDENTYKFQIEDISYDNEVGTEEIKDQTLYKYSEAYGVVDSEDIYLYLPGTPIRDLPNEILTWIGYYNESQSAADTLQGYAIYNAKQKLGFIGKEKKGPYEYAMESIASAKATVDSLKERATEDSLTQDDMNNISAQKYKAWDDSLNYIWSLIKENLPEDEFSKLLDEQRQWIKDKESKIDEAGAEFQGGTLEAYTRNNMAADLTEKRAYELAEYLK